MSKQQDFWSRRKAGVLSEQEAYARAEELRGEEISAAIQAEKSDEDILTELNLPDPDSLELGDDFRAFMTKAVPDRIRRRALRRLWLTNPALANLDGLIDYGEDFTDSATVIENLQTAYQVGKGMMTHVEEMAREASEEATPEENLAITEEEKEHEGGTIPADSAVVENSASEPDEIASTYENSKPDVVEEDSTPSMPKRRMQFVFGDDFGARA
ncbi:hypothetical protein ROA7450_00704 [Roseovarius albus]|uniref:DUF3306 domain-containing protein n=1 Tax=Roseovarius albus TaxID=1247867 RepID=A0A1X6YGG3_9RHOB|nr:DUF3306 domain-containing protein [Roseovarius albus]SLN20591.1 hypothetical protein ROA7450_00704 [Roseovarius albus]